MTKHMLALLAATATVFAACADSHGYVGPPDIAPDRRVADLNDAEWAEFCDWAENLFVERYGEARYVCDGSPTILDNTAESCVRNGRVGISTECALTVETWAACLDARAAIRCWEGVTLPECERATCDPPDAGM